MALILSPKTERRMSVRQKQAPGLYRQIIRLTAPIVLQNLLSAAVNSADVVMLNFVGPAHISAVSLAAQYASVLFMVFYGLGTGATMLCSQYYGKGSGKRGVSATEQEYDAAGMVDCERWVYLKAVDKRDAKAAAFVSRVNRDVTRTLFSTFEDLKSAVYASFVAFLDRR